MSIDEKAGIVPETAEEVVEQVQETTGGGFSMRLPDWVYIKRSNEPIETYMQHAFNFNQSEGMAYIIRGFSALVGDILDYWWTDVIGGVLRLRKGAKAE